MAEYINREDAYRAIRSSMFDKMRTFPKRRQRLISLLLDLISVVGHIPAADVRENVHGRWIEYNKLVSDLLVCSECERYFIGLGDEYDYNFCPNCGADMRGKNNGQG